MEQAQQSLLDFSKVRDMHCIVCSLRDEACRDGGKRSLPHSAPLMVFVPILIPIYYIIILYIYNVYIYI